MDADKSKISSAKKCTPQIHYKHDIHTAYIHNLAIVNLNTFAK